ncbi:MAG: hypothetical protein LC802_00090 [Acidobacteria bacterium]|nr:hypothetical protein [Acidobacteriota bacterium]
MRAVLLAWLLIVSQPIPFCLGLTTGEAAPGHGGGVTWPAQNGATLTLRLGAASVALPAPEGFGEAASQSEIVKKHFSETEDPANEMVAVHLPAAEMESLKRGEVAEMNFYTKVSVNKSLKETNFTAANFASVISAFEQQGVKLLAPNNSEMRDTVKRVEDIVNSRSETGAKMSMSPPQYLGAFEQTPNVYSLIILARLSIKSGAEVKEIPVLCAASFVVVKARLLYVYVYRRYNSEADLNALKDFSSKWTAQIVAANRA